MQASYCPPRWTSAEVLQRHADELKTHISKMDVTVDPNDLHTLAVVCTFLRYLRTPTIDASQLKDANTMLRGPVIDILENHFQVSYELSTGLKDTKYAHLDDIRRILSINELLRNEPVIAVSMESVSGRIYVRARVMMSRFCYQLDYLDDGVAAPEPRRKSPRGETPVGCGPMRNKPKEHKGVRTPFDRMKCYTSVVDQPLVGGMVNKFAYDMLYVGLLKGVQTMQSKIASEYPHFNRDDQHAISIAAIAAVNCVARHTGWTCKRCNFVASDNDEVVTDPEYISRLFREHGLKLSITEDVYAYEIRVSAAVVNVCWEYAAALIGVTQRKGGLQWMRVGAETVDPQASTGDAYFGDGAPPETGYLSVYKGTAGATAMDVAAIPVMASYEEPHAYLSLGVKKAQFSAIIHQGCEVSLGVDPHLPGGCPCLQCTTCIQGARVSRQQSYHVARTTGKAGLLPPTRAVSSHPMVPTFHTNPLYGKSRLS